MPDGKSGVQTIAGGLMPLGMTCTSTDCHNDLHFFRPKPDRTRKLELGADPMNNIIPLQPRLMEESHPPRRQVSNRGPCRVCGADLIDWERVTRRDLVDVAHTFQALSSCFNSDGNGS